LAPDFASHHRRTLGHPHARCGRVGGLPVPPCQRAPRRLPMETPRPLHQTPQAQRHQEDHPQGFHALRLLQAQPSDNEGGLPQGDVRLYSVQLLRGPQPLSRARGHLPRRRPSGQQPTTAPLLHRGGDALRPLVERGRPAIPPRWDHAGLRLARPARARLGVLLDQPFPAVIGARVRPQRGGSGLRSCTAAIRLWGRRAPGRFERRLGRRALTRQRLLPPLRLPARVPDDCPRGLPLAGEAALGYFLAGPRPGLRRGRLGQPAALLPVVAGASRL